MPCHTYLTLQDAVSCFLCALGQVAVCGAWDGWLRESVAERLDGAEGSRSGKTVWLISTRGASDMMGETADCGVRWLQSGEG
jgi:hypothetical protein